MTSSPNPLTLLDTNVLVYALQEDSPQYAGAKALRDRALNGEVVACLSPQVLSEFFVAVTRTDKRAVQRPISCEQATVELRKYCASEHLLLIYPGPRIMERIFWLLERHPITGLQLHDLHLVATMLENDVTRVYTYNTQHFAPFSEIEALTPPEPEPEPEPVPAPSPDQPIA